MSDDLLSEAIASTVTRLAELPPGMRAGVDQLAAAWKAEAQEKHVDLGDPVAARSMVLGYTNGLAAARVVLTALVDATLLLDATLAAVLADAIRHHPYVTVARTALCQLVSEAERRAE